MDDLEARIDGLYALPLADFTTARNLLARELRRAGDRASADTVKALRKPTMTAWAVNQVVHHYPEVWSGLLRATELIRQAHATGPGALASAIAGRKSALAQAVQTTEGVLRRGGGAVTAPSIRRLTGSLEALAAGAEGASPGRLTVDLEPPGFGGLTGLDIAGIPEWRGRTEGIVAAGRKDPQPVSGAKVEKTKRREIEQRAPDGPRPISGKKGASAQQERVAAERAREAAAAMAEASLERARAALEAVTRAAEEHDAAQADAKRQAELAAAATDAARLEAEAARARLLEAQAAQAGLERRLKRLAGDAETLNRSRSKAEKALEEAKARLAATRR